jgi:hypothetical protein
MALEIGTASSHTDLFAKLKTFLKAGENAASTLTVSANPGNGETVVIGGKTYTFQTTLTNVDGNVQIGASADASLDNLKAAINLEATVSPQQYAAAMTLHSTVRAVRGSATTLIVRAKTPGTGGNSIGVTETLANGSWSASNSPQTLSGGGVDAWTEIGATSPLTTNMSIFQAPGVGGVSPQEQNYFGFGYEANVGTDSYAITGWMFRTYSALLGHQSQPGHSGVGYHPVWDQSTPYWFIANGRRVIIVTKVSTSYTASYIGKILPYGTPGEWPQPYYLGMPYESNTRWSSTSHEMRNFFDPGSHDGSRMLNPSGVWYAVANFKTQSSAETDATDTNNIWPYQALIGTTSTTAKSRYRELRNNVDDATYTLWPLILCGDTPATDIWGELDGAYACPGFSAATEDIITNDYEQHLLVQDIARTARYNYCAIKLL